MQVEELPRFDDGRINVTEPIRVAVHYLVDEVMDGLGVRGLRARQPEKRLQGAQTPHMRGRDRAQDPQAESESESESTPIPLTPFTPPSGGLRLWANWPLWIGYTKLDSSVRAISNGESYGRP